MRPERETRRLLERAFDGRLTVEERLRLDVLAQDHAACAELLERNRALLDALEGLPEPAVDRLDVEHSLIAIHAAIDAAPHSGPSSERVGLARAHRARGLMTAGIAAGALLALGVWLTARDRSEPDRAMGTSTAQAPDPARLDPGRADPVAPVVEVASSIGVVSFPGVELPATDFDGDKLKRVRREVREHLTAAARGVDLARGGETELRALADRFEAATAHLTAADWPVGSIVRRLITDEDAQMGAAAARYLALRDPRQALPRLIDALEEESRAPAIVAALADVARESSAELVFEGLARAAADPDLAPRALELVAGLEPERVQRVVRHALARGETAEMPLLELLTTQGLDGALVLLELGAKGVASEDLVLDALERTPLADRAAAEVLSVPSARTERFLLLVIERLRPAEGVAWTTERCVNGDNRRLAASVLAGYAGHDALWGLLHAQESGRLGGDDFLWAFRVAVTSHPARLRDFVREELADSQHARRRRSFVEFLVLSERPQTVPALLELAMDRELPSADRESALLAAAEIGGGEYAAELEAYLPSFDAAEHRLSAACLYAVHRLGGPEAAQRALAFLDERPRARLLDHLSDPRAAQRPTTTLYKLARELEPVLDARGRRTRRSFP